MKYVIDIDGVICNEDVPVIDRTPYVSRVKLINDLYDNGDTIVYFTARGMRSQNDHQIASDLKYRKLTEQQLNEWGCKYHKIVFGKPNADVYIDNKNMMMDEFFNE